MKEIPGLNGTPMGKWGYVRIYREVSARKHCNRYHWEITREDDNVNRHLDGGYSGYKFTARIEAKKRLKKYLSGDKPIYEKKWQA